MELSIELILFYVVGACAIASSVLMILQRNPVMSALYLIGNFFCLAALYLLLHAQFLAVIQIVVYAGAIMVLVVFVIMLLNLGDEQRLTEKLNYKVIGGTVVVFAFLLEMLYVFGSGTNAPGVSGATQGRVANLGTVESMGDALFSRFVLPFEVTSLLLLAAIIGAVILAKRKT